jgi:hypothetical protein
MSFRPWDSAIVYTHLKIQNHKVSAWILINKNMRRPC